VSRLQFSYVKTSICQPAIVNSELAAVIK